MGARLCLQLACDGLKLLGPLPLQGSCMNLCHSACVYLSVCTRLDSACCRPQRQVLTGGITRASIGRSRYQNRSHQVKQVSGSHWCEPGEGRRVSALRLRKGSRRGCWGRVPSGLPSWPKRCRSRAGGTLLLPHICGAGGLGLGRQRRQRDAVQGVAVHAQLQRHGRARCLLLCAVLCAVLAGLCQHRRGSAGRAHGCGRCGAGGRGPDAAGASRALGAGAGAGATAGSTAAGTGTVDAGAGAGCTSMACCRACTICCAACAACCAVCAACTAARAATCTVRSNAASCSDRRSPTRSTTARTRSTPASTCARCAACSTWRCAAARSEPSPRDAATSVSARMRACSASAGGQGAEGRRD